MALDSPNERAAALNTGIAVPLVLPLPAGDVVDVLDRAHVLSLFWPSVVADVLIIRRRGDVALSLREHAHVTPEARRRGDVAPSLREHAHVTPEARRRGDAATSLRRKGRI